MSWPMKLAASEDLPLTPASGVKKQGWRGDMRAVDRQGSLVVTHHGEPEAVIPWVQTYRDLRQALAAGAGLFRARPAWLTAASRPRSPCG